MGKRRLALAVLALAAGIGALLATSGDVATLPETAGMGPAPQLPPPVRSVLPTLSMPRGRGWAVDEKPVASPGLAVARYADGLDHPRSLHVMPNGDVLVAETNAPASQFSGLGAEGAVRRAAIRWLGSGRPSANRVTLLRDADGDGVAETRATLLTDLNSPFGIAYGGGYLYVANTDRLVRYPYEPGATSIAASAEVVADLPAGDINQHWTRNIVMSRDGTQVYVAVGSASDHGEHGPAMEEKRAAVWIVDVKSKVPRIYADGLRNPVGLAWEPHSGALWTTVNERDGLGSDLVPDYMTALRDGAFYGWPRRYFGEHVDPRVAAAPDGQRKALAPDYALGAHVSPLGLAFVTHGLSGPWRSGALVAEHGSWNRRPRSGYKVVFVPFENGRPRGLPVDMLTGFLDAAGDARGRPASVGVDTAGAVLVADDLGGILWRITAAPR